MKRVVRKPDKFFTLYGLTEGIRERATSIRTEMCSTMKTGYERGWSKNPVQDKIDECIEAIKYVEAIEDLLSRTKQIVLSEKKKHEKRLKSDKK